MNTRIQKWGQSLAVRIPKKLAEEAGLHDESAVDVSLIDGRLIVALVTVWPRYRLKKLVAKITAENLHQEIEISPAQGNEAW